MRLSHRVPLLSIAGAAVIVLASVRIAGGSTIWQRTDGPFFSQALLWKPASLTDENLRALYRRLAPAMRPRRAWLVEVFVDAADAQRELHGKLTTEGTYQRWLRLYSAFGRKPLAMAELFGYANNAVLRLRDAAGICSEVVLAGNNFLRIESGGVRFEILHIYYHPLPPDVAPSPGDEAMISVYVRASQPPDLDRAEELSTLLQRRLRQKRVDVSIRTDSFFISDDSFPVVYRFDELSRPPTEREYASSQTVSCMPRITGFLAVGGIRCVNSAQAQPADPY